MERNWNLKDLKNLSEEDEATLKHMVSKYEELAPKDSKESETYKRIMATYSEPELAQDIANYITMAFNDASLLGNIDREEMTEQFPNTVEGLALRILITHIDERCVHGGYYTITVKGKNQHSNNIFGVSTDSESTDRTYRSDKYIKGWEYVETWNEHFNKRYSQFLASYIFLRLLFSRVVGGQTYKMALEEIKSRQPINITQG